MNIRTALSRRLVAGVAVTLVLPLSLASTPAQAAAAPSAGAPYVSVAHAKLADAKVKARSVLSFAVLGVHGLPATGASAVVLTVSDAAPGAAGSLVVYGAGAKRPAVLSVSLVKGHASSSDVVVLPGAAGRVNLFNSSSVTQHVVVTARAYYAAPGTVKAGNATAAFVPVTPRRLASVAIKAAAGTSLVALGKLGVATTGVAGVVISLSATAPAVSGALVAYPAGGKAPKQSTLSLHKGQAVTAAVVVKTGSLGRISVTNRSTKPVRVLVDVVGYLLTLHAPGVPLAVTAAARNASVLLSWTPPAADGGAPISSYRIVTVPGGAVTSVPASPTSAVVGGLTNGTGYTFTVVAVNSRGAGPVSAPTAPVIPVTVPGTPTGLTAAPNGVGQAKLSWTAPADTGGSPVTGYQVVSSPAGGIAAVVGTTATVTGLASGQYYTFTVTATNAVGSSAATAATPAIVAGGASLASVTTAGVQGDGLSYEAAISADGRYVAFVSFADNLVSGDGNGAPDVFVRDRLTRTTTLVSVNSAGTGSGNASSVSPSISADGRYVAFTSVASNLVSSTTTTHSNIFRRDLVTGTTTLVSRVNAGEDNAGNAFPSISADGSKIAFRSSATNLVTNFTSGANSIYLADLTAGSIVPVSVTPVGGQAGGNNDAPSISADGGHVAFESTGTNVVTSPTASGITQVYERDMAAGTTVMVSAVGTSAESNGLSSNVTLSADGRFAAFVSLGTNLVVGDDNMADDAFVTDTAHSIVTRVSVGPHNSELTNPTNRAAISADGSAVVFVSQSPAVVPGDAGAFSQVFRINVSSLVAQQVSLSNAGAEGSGGSDNPAVSPDGQHVAFESSAGNLVAGDSNLVQDIVVADLG